MTKVDLYEILKIKKDASVSAIRKAYHNQARRTHPDKNKGDPKAVQNFQAVQKAYSVLSNKDRRKHYDETGDLEDDSTGFWKAYEHFRGKKVTKEDIESYEKKYRFSKEEKTDLESFFKEHKGDVTKVLACVMFARTEDIDRFNTFFEDLVKKTKYKKFKKVYNQTKESILSLEEFDEEIASAQSDSQSSEEESDVDDLDGFIVPDNRIEGGDLDVEASDTDSDSEKENQKFMKGDEVKVKWKGGAKYYNAVVIKQGKGNVYDVEYEDGSKEEKVKPVLMKAAPKKSAKRKIRASPKLDTVDDLRNAILGNKKRRGAGFDAFKKRWTK
eukprot:maker-scaffold_18-snap-gene-2.56-mRNA-1 protein AED:0.01 eAED:0.01 QI:98/1/1/1/1/1/4/157/327